MPVVMAIFIVAAAIICHQIGVPDRMIIFGAGFMLFSLLLQVFWVKNSIARMMVLTCLTSAAAFAFVWYFFNTLLWIIIPGTIFVLVGLYVNSIWLKRSTAKSKERIAQWAEANGWRLLEFEHRFDTGPFGGIHWKGQMYFEFVVTDQRGKRHTGWAHFDHSLFGGGRYEVKWIETSQQPSNEKSSAK